MKKYYLISTQHLEDALWFMEDEDFVTGMNYVAIQAVLMPEVMILVFILMSNHVHFVLYGSREEVAAFANNFKGRYSLYLNRKYGHKEFLRRNTLNVKELPIGEEALERAMAYVQMNSVAASICLYPGQYPWGTGNTFFQAASQSGKTGAGNRCVGNLSGRERISLMHSEEALKLPADWILSDQGFVLPECYVNVNKVESVFRYPKRMQYFLNSSSKARKRLEADNDNLPAFRDQVILTALPDLLQSLFHKSAFALLSESEQAETLRQLRYRFSANVHQLARVCGLSYADAARLMDSA